MKKNSEVKSSKIQEPIHGREILAVIGVSKGAALLTGSEDATFKVLSNFKDTASPICASLSTTQTFS